MEKQIKLPIKQLVEFILHSGDIDSRYVEKDRMYEGAKAHRYLQKKNSELYEEYKSEVALAQDFVYNDAAYRIEGRADGVIKDAGRVIIEEIKTTILPVDLIEEDFNITHWAQAKCYACIYAAQNNLSRIDVRLVYFNIDTKETKFFLKSFETDELNEFLTGLIAKYSVWTAFSSDWEALRDLSIKELQFPYPSYRTNQRELAVFTYKAVLSGKKLFAQAPTGIGKTISTLFPAVKAMGEGKTSKIFYLTAKTITRQVADEALGKMRQAGLKMKSLTLTAKEKICFCEKTVCNPDYCEYAKGHYDRVNDAVFDAIKSCDSMTRNEIEEFAKKHKVCPFELSLDISLWADCVICDYNYVFDPRAYLRRFFADNNGDYVFLIDEAHNLVDRSRGMFSSQLLKSRFYAVRKNYKGKNKALDKILNEINKHMISIRKRCGEQGFFVAAEQQTDFLDLVNKYISTCELMLKEDRRLGEDNEFLQLYFEALNYILISDFYDERYVTMAECRQGEVAIKLFCLDPSFLIGEALKRGGSAVLFSATLTPLDYFRKILGGCEGDGTVALGSPFDSRRLCLMTAVNVSTRYKNRQQSVQNIVGLISSFVSRKTGNYIVYFPSYKYLKDVFEPFAASHPDIAVLEQESSMTEESREEFLAGFQEHPTRTLVAFCVLGGVFSEGIDLKGSRLIGTVIVGVGLPQLNVQQDIIRDHFNGKNGLGYEYAYMYPGMNKVLQAAGRVIRCESDRGAVLLIDDRFGQYGYKKLFPKHWNNYRVVRDGAGLEKMLDAFWAESPCDEEMKNNNLTNNPNAYEQDV